MKVCFPQPLPAGWVAVLPRFGTVAVYSAKVWLAFQRLRGLKAGLKRAHRRIRHPVLQFTLAAAERIELQSNTDTTMAFRTLPSFCTDTAYKDFLPLRGFSPAKGFCSNLAVHQRSLEYDPYLDSRDSVPIAAYPHSQRDVQCPAESGLCSLLSKLQSADKTIAHNAW